MTVADSENMVLRTVYLPIEMDRVIRQFAFTEGKSKGELIREFIADALAQREARGEKSIAQELDGRPEAVAQRPARGKNNIAQKPDRRTSRRVA